MTNSYPRRLLLDRFNPGSQDQARGHIVELDSLRGAAAMFVVLQHFTQGWNEASPPNQLRYAAYVPFVFNGLAAVMLFFVLSGFVLTLPMLSAKRQDYPTYAVRRICRIYLPYLAALGVALVGCWRFHGLDMYGAVFQTIWRAQPSLGLVAEHLAFLGRYDVFAFNPPTWSLVHEMRISLIFPLLCLVALRLRAWAAFAIAVSLPIAGKLVERLSAAYPDGDTGTAATFFWHTIGYCGIFLVGALLARYRQPVVAWLAALPAALKWALAAVATGLYQYPTLLHARGRCATSALAWERRTS